MHTRTHTSTYRCTHACFHARTRMYAHAYGPETKLDSACVAWPEDVWLCFGCTKLPARGAVCMRVPPWNRGASEFRQTWYSSDIKTCVARWLPRAARSERKLCPCGAWAAASPPRPGPATRRRAALCLLRLFPALSSLL